MDDYPHLAAMYEHAVTYDYSFDGEFEFGLDLILDGFEQTRYLAALAVLIAQSSVMGGRQQ